MWHRSGFGRAALIGVALAAITACAPDDLLGPEAEQGIDGIALRGPMCPVESPDDPCPDQPHQAWVTLLNSDGDVVTRFQTGSDGRFRVGLRPGLYRLVPDQGDPFPTASEVAAVVAWGVYTEVVINFDTGIR